MNIKQIKVSHRNKMNIPIMNILVWASINLGCSMLDAENTLLDTHENNDSIQNPESLKSAEYSNRGLELEIDASNLHIFINCESEKAFKDLENLKRCIIDSDVFTTQINNIVGQFRDRAGFIIDSVFFFLDRYLTEIKLILKACKFYPICCNKCNDDVQDRAIVDRFSGELVNLMKTHFLIYKNLENPVHCGAQIFFESSCILCLNLSESARDSYMKGFYDLIYKRLNSREDKIIFLFNEVQTYNDLIPFIGSLKDFMNMFNEDDIIEDKRETFILYILQYIKIILCVTRNTGLSVEIKKIFLTIIKQFNNGLCDYICSKNIENYCVKIYSKCDSDHYILYYFKLFDYITESLRNRLIRARNVEIARIPNPHKPVNTMFDKFIPVKNTREGFFYHCVIRYANFIRFNYYFFRKFQNKKRCPINEFVDKFQFMLNVVIYDWEHSVNK